MAIDLTTSGRLQGWCPNCDLRSVIATPERLVCSSPQCQWESPRSDDIEDTVFSGPPPLTRDRLNRLRGGFGLEPS